MADLNTRKSEIFGSLHKIVIYNAAQITSISEPSANVINPTAIESGGFENYNVDFQLESAEAKSSGSQTAHGVAYKQILEFIFSGKDEEAGTLTNRLQSMEQKRWFAFITEKNSQADGNLTRRIMGNIDTDSRGKYIGMEFKVDWKSGKKYGELLGYAIHMECESRHPIYMLNS